MSAPKKQKRVNNYKGYTIDKGDEIDVLHHIPTAAEFWESFIKLRKPVKFSRQDILDLDKFSANNINDYLLYDLELQVERRHNYGFGGGHSREKLTLEQILNRFRKGDRSYYLTTQYDFDDPEFEQIEESESEVDNSDGGEGFGAGFSDTSSMASLDMNDLHDDFDYLDDNQGEVNDSNDENGTVAVQVASDNESSEEEDELHKQDDNDNDMSDEELKSRLTELLQPPLTNLHGKIPIVPELFKTLVPQQVNLWMGCTDPAIDLKEAHPPIDETKSDLGLGRYIPSGGTSSGLHHDHADNLYILVQGRKRFTLISPMDAEKLQTVGTIFQIFENGIIDYDEDERAPDWAHVRDDGALVTETLAWKLETEETLSEANRKAIESALNASKIAKKAKTVVQGLKVDPPSFSSIPPCLLHLDEISDSEYRETLVKFAEKYFPGFLQLNKMTVELQPGEMLYLPSGWFHEVSSFGTIEAKDPLDHVHIALNYWMVPPNNLQDLSNCYRDNYYVEDWERTKNSLYKTLSHQ